MYSLSVGMQNVPAQIYENTAWFIYYSSQYDLDRIKANNRKAAMAAQGNVKKPLRGSSLMAALNKAK